MDDKKIRENPRFRRYPKYKESGVEWIGKIPSYWHTATIKHLTKNLDGKRIPLSGEVRAEQEQIYPYYGANGVIDYVEDYIFQGEHILIGEDGAPFFDKTREVSLLASGKFWVNNHCHILKNISTSEARFIVHCLNSVDYFEYITGSTRDKLTQADLNRIKIPVPTYQEQGQIANFLDRKTGQIDELIRIKERRIELLQEQRTALINQVVTKGLDPNVEMKPSGVEWIGEIPKHWTFTRLKYVSSIPVTYGINIEADRYTTEGIRLIRITDIDESGSLRQKGVYLSEDCVPQEQILNSYDLLLSRSGATVGKSYLHLEKGKYASAGYLVRFNFDDYWTSKFIYYLTLSHFYRNWLEQQIIISTIQNVNGEKYSNFQLPIPSHQEHKQIVQFLNCKTQQIDELISAEHQKIEFLKEYRQSLISEVVTGKIDIRNEV